ncbi:hypothetical protein CANTEDRAFT_114566 [Yamadazyma tenuis ATCC 10573]|uniref:Uncharacterized protein n=1 Tax=Candida tenuis (strain ATCC 10573 / BCRC 21748 / CBS 615 / JCM 9827 / NBRC 10315 / NRRL Y-1498 / VKM Y-70) TaxID=590646 RepID=G3B5N6_CANTC|nr:uncharacterized protein CANTEDRAFT_114566 [Yamadazyma tenuis ATCC 10573]EGV63271.1 hypothetical protein CANTEDRAFT_114566 [Yamadazyma tenuis ATCC 10573]
MDLQHEIDIPLNPEDPISSHEIKDRLLDEWEGKMLKSFRDYDEWASQMTTLMKSINPKFINYINGELSESEIGQDEFKRSLDYLYTLFRLSMSDEIFKDSIVDNFTPVKLWSHLKDRYEKLSKNYYSSQQKIMEVLTDTSTTGDMKLDSLLAFPQDIFKIIEFDVCRELVTYSKDSIITLAYNILIKNEVDMTLRSLQEEVKVIKSASDAAMDERCAKCQRSGHNHMMCTNELWCNMEGETLSIPGSENLFPPPNRS